MKLLSSTRKNHKKKKASVALLIGTQGENKKQKNCFNWAPIIVACLQLLWLNLTRSAKHASNTGAGSNQPAFCIFGPMGQPPWHVWSHGFNQPGLGVCGNSPFSCLQGSPAVKSVGTILLFDGILFCDIGIDSDPLLRGEQYTHLPSLCWRYIDTTADKGKHS